MPVAVTVNGSRELKAKINKLGKAQRRVVKTAQRKAIKTTRTRAIRDTVLVLNLKRARVSKQIESGSDAVYVRLGRRGKDVPPTLAGYGGRHIRIGNRSGGYKARTWKGLGVRHYKSGFQVSGKEPPFTREGRAKYPIRVMYGPRIGIVFDQIHKSLIDVAAERYTIEWRRAVQGVLTR